MKPAHSVFFALIFTLCSFGSAFAQEPAPEGYRFGTGDKIFIKVFDESDLTMETIVGSSGTINYSFLGQIQVAGRTSAELEQELTTLLADGYLLNPSVNVSVIEYRPFFINGEVKKPGGYPYQPGLTLEKAVALAGGLTDRASKRKIYLQPASSGDSKKQKVSMGSRIAPGDIITVEEGFF
ncbi:polysaccharide biosynthesis/export family protein [Granulosicoccaceae sp. 1_MG-2023]|nr:polysaccharide biosynthesis/export family protein [Granulosicoccaceae sp. 1_MG-2023]